MEREESNLGSVGRFMSKEFIDGLSSGRILYAIRAKMGIDVFLDGLLDGSHYNFLVSERRRFAEGNGENVDLMLGVKEEEGVLLTYVVCYNELMDVSKVRSRVGGYRFLDINELRAISTKLYSTNLKKRKEVYED